MWRIRFSSDSLFIHFGSADDNVVITRYSLVKYLYSSVFLIVLISNSDERGEDRDKNLDNFLISSTMAYLCGLQ